MIKPTRKQTVLAAGGSLAVAVALLLTADSLATPHGVLAQAAPAGAGRRHSTRRHPRPAPPSARSQRAAARTATRPAA